MTAHDTSDWELLGKASRSSAFATLADRHYRPALAFCIQVLGDAHRAEDVVQRGFFQVFQARRRLLRRARFKTLLYKVLLNLCRDELARRTSALPFSALASGEGGAPPAFPDARIEEPPATAESREADAMLGSALMQLRPEHRAALWLREHEGLAYEEIARALGASLAEVKVWIHRARAKLVELLRPYLDRGEGVS